MQEREICGLLRCDRERVKRFEALEKRSLLTLSIASGAGDFLTLCPFLALSMQQNPATGSNRSKEIDA
jgi:hypothetical protein